MEVLLGHGRTGRGIGAGRWRKTAGAWPATIKTAGRIASSEILLMNFVASREMSPLLHPQREVTMDTQLTHAARIELARSLRQRYQAASSRANKQILSEFIAVSGYHPKYAIHLLNAADAAAAPRRGRVRPTIYDDAAKRALIVLWEASDRVCGKRLKPL